MHIVDWRSAERKLEHLTSIVTSQDIYWTLNIVAPLRNRYFGGERTLRLYNEIMRLCYAPEPQTPAPVHPAIQPRSRALNQ